MFVARLLPNFFVHTAGEKLSPTSTMSMFTFRSLGMRLGEKEEVVSFPGCSKAVRKEPGNVTRLKYKGNLKGLRERWKTL